MIWEKSTDYFPAYIILLVIRSAINKAEHFLFSYPFSSSWWSMGAVWLMFASFFTVVEPNVLGSKNIPISKKQEQFDSRLVDQICTDSA